MQASLNDNGRGPGNAGTNKENIVRQWFVDRDLFALSSDYQAREKETQLFFAEVQNKLLFAVAGNTAAEAIRFRQGYYGQIGF